MPLIEKGILIEGPNGETIVHKYCVMEKPPNPYDKFRLAMEEQNRNARRQMRKRVPPHEKGYVWRMGYNLCAGTYSGSDRYCPFSGSSLNRDKNLMYEKKEIVAGSAAAALALAHKKARPYYQRGLPIPKPLHAFICRQTAQTAGGFRMWLSGQNDRFEDGISLPIHVLSPRSRGKIRDKATAFFRACPGQRVFCTLTFIAPVADATGVAILNKFLTTVRKGFPNLQYLWVAERQENTNIHFHIILNKRLPIGQWNAMWVLQQYNAGLSGQTEYGELIEKGEIERLYAMDVKENFSGVRGKNGKKISRIQKILNPVHVKKVDSIAGLSAYLTKYITKQKEGFFGCSPWHSSRGVSRLFTKATVGPSAFAYMMGLGNCKVDKSTGEVFMPQRVRPKGRGGAFCILVYVNKKDAPLRYLREMETINKWLIGGQVGDVKGTIETLTNETYRRNYCQPTLN